MAIIPGKLEITIKINQLPTEVITDKNGWKGFSVACGERVAQVNLRPRMWNRLEQAASSYPHWVAVLTGQMGPDVQKGAFKLLEPNLQVFEYKPRAAAPAGDGEAAQPDAPAAPDGGG